MEIKTIIASEGMILTNGSAYGRRIALGSLDSAENWHEVPISEEETAEDTDYITALESLGVDFNA